MVKYSESRVAQVENNVKYLRRENEELKLDLEILRSQMPSRSRNTSLTDDSSSTISRFEYQVSQTESTSCNEDNFFWSFLIFNDNLQQKELFCKI